MTLGDWGVATPAQVPAMVDLLTPFSLVGEFDDFTPAGAPTGGWKGNANDLGQWAINWARDGALHQLDGSAAPDGQLRYNPGFNTDNTVEEDTRALFPVRLRPMWARCRPTCWSVRAMSGRTSRRSTSSSFRGTAVAGRQRLPGRSFHHVHAGHRDGGYDNVLPSLDFDIGLTDTLKARFSYSKTIARAEYGN